MSKPRARPGNPNQISDCGLDGYFDLQVPSMVITTANIKKITIMAIIIENRITSIIFARLP